MKDRELTPDTKWIICMWDIRGEDITETARLMKRSIKQVEEILEQCRADGYYDRVRRHIEYFDIYDCAASLCRFIRTIAEGMDVDENDG